MLMIFLFLVTLSTGQVKKDDFPWYEPSKPFETRIELLVHEMTLEEKIGQMMNSSPAIPRLGIPPYDWWNECLHGVARAGKATVFPQTINMAATFDDDLVYRIFSAASDEARIKYNAAVKKDFRERYTGLTFWAPNVNIFRDPRWGRGQETFGEDPFLTSKMGVAAVSGLQGNDKKYLKTAACAKHFAVHSGPEELRHEFNAVVSPKDLWETYLPAFQSLVKDARVEGIMAAYNRTLGEACSASPFLLTEVLRNQWKFDGYIVSDCDAVEDIWKTHKIATEPEDAAAMAVKAGLNLECGSEFVALKNAISRGLLNESDIDRALIQLFKTRFRLGLFDPDENNPYSNIDPNQLRSTEHIELALEAARKSLVLLKNNNVLPLDKNKNSVWVTGPNAASVDALIGNYFGLSDNFVTVVEGLAGEIGNATKMIYTYGQLPYQFNTNPIDWTTPIAKRKEACIAVLGYTNQWEGEEGESIASESKGDLVNCRLPEAQVEFIRKLRKDNSKPLIVILTGGSPIIVPEIYEMADVLIYAFYPGEQGGKAIADLIFGNISPSGRLPFTVPFSVDDLPPFDDYKMEGRTYRYMGKDPLFPFGFGLGYSRVNYGNMSVKPVDDGVVVSFDVENAGIYPLEEVAQIYISSPLAGKGEPLYSLKAYQRVPLKNGERKRMSFVLKKECFYQINADGESYLPEGNYLISAGGSLPGRRSEVLGASVSVSQLVSSKLF